MIISKHTFRKMIPTDFNGIYNYIFLKELRRNVSADYDVT